MTGEAHFTLSGGDNKQNCRFWGTEYPLEIHETPLHDQKESMEIDIGACWISMSTRECVKKVWTVIGFNKMVRHTTPQIKQFSFCNEISLDVWYQKEATLTGHRDL